MKRRTAPQHRGPFAARLLRYRGKSRWTFAIVPKKHAPPVTRPWGRTPVRATVNGVTWDTSIWRDARNDRSLLALPARVRGRTSPGDTVTVEFTFEPEDDV